MPGNLQIHRENDIIFLLLGLYHFRYSSVAAPVLAHRGGYFFQPFLGFPIKCIILSISIYVATSLARGYMLNSCPYSVSESTINGLNIFHSLLCINNFQLFFASVLCLSKSKCYCPAALPSMSSVISKADEVCVSCGMGLLS